MVDFFFQCSHAFLYRGPQSDEETNWLYPKAHRTTLQMQFMDAKCEKTNPIHWYNAVFRAHCLGPRLVKLFPPNTLDVDD